MALFSADASATKVSSGASLYIDKGGWAYNTTLYSFGKMTIASGGTATSTTIASGASMNLYSGGYAESNYISSGGRVDVWSNGIVSSTYIAQSGTVNVSSGGTAVKTTLGVAGIMKVLSGGKASGTVMSGGFLNLYGSSYDGVYNAGSVTIGENGYSNNEVFSNTSTFVMSGASGSGVVYGGTVGSGCSVFVSGGRFGGKTTSDAVFNIKGGNVDVAGVKGAKAWISGGVFYASGGGTMSSATVEPLVNTLGKMYVFSGTTASKVDVYANGHLGIMVGGVVMSAIAHPSSGMSSATIGVSSGGWLGVASVSGGDLDVGSGGFVRNAYLYQAAYGVVKGTIASANVGSGCPLQVSSGGIVSSALLETGGRINLNQGKLSSVFVQSGGTLSVNSDGWAGSGNVYGLAVVSYGGRAAGLTVSSGGRMTVSAYGAASGCSVYGGTADVYSGGSFNNGTVSSGGTVTMNNGAIALSCTVGSGGVMKISSGAAYNGFKILNGGKVTGNYDCYGITFSSGGIADINIFNTSAGNTKAVVSNLYYARNKGTVFTLTVSASQANGTYKLSDNASGFNESITVQNIYGDVRGTLTVGQTVNIGSSSYKLELGADDVLSVSVGSAAAASAKSDVDGNGVSDVMFVWTGEHGEGNYQHGYWMNGTSTWRSANTSHPATWDNLGNYDMTGDGKADSVLFGNVDAYEVPSAYIGYYKDGVDTDDNWVTIGFLTNAAGINWKNAVGNVTGGSSNSIIWHAAELGALGAWTDGTDNWINLGGGFDSTWTLIGCGDFSGDGKDSVLMSHNSGAEYWGIDYYGTFTLLGASDNGWEVRAIGDFSGDGKDDIITFHKDTGIVAKWADGQASNWSQLGQLDAKDWFVVGAGDYNGDAKDDLLVRQNSTGMLGYYSGGNMSNWVELGRGVDMNWTVIA